MFKGIVSIENLVFFKILKINFWGGNTWFSHLLAVFCEKSSKIMFLLASIKSFTNCKMLRCTVCTHEREERPGQKVDVAFGNFFRISKYFRSSQQIFYIIFCFNRPAKI
jgi:hypothetical protein